MAKYARKREEAEINADKEVEDVRIEATNQSTNAKEYNLLIVPRARSSQKWYTHLKSSRLSEMNYIQIVHFHCCCVFFSHSFWPLCRMCVNIQF